MSENQSFFFMVGKIHRLASLEFGRQLSSIGITQGLAAVLLHLDLIGEGKSQGEIAGSMEVAPPTAVPLVSKLVKMNLLVKRPYAGDKRRVAVYFTPSGFQMLSEVKAVYRATFQKLFGHLGNDELDRTEGLLQAVYNNSKILK